MSSKPVKSSIAGELRSFLDNQPLKKSKPVKAPSDLPDSDKSLIIGGMKLLHNHIVELREHAIKQDKKYKKLKSKRASDKLRPRERVPDPAIQEANRQMFLRM